jgi:hypothetical protein
VNGEIFFDENEFKTHIPEKVKRPSSHAFLLFSTSSESKTICRPGMECCEYQLQAIRIAEGMTNQYQETFF